MSRKEEEGERESEERREEPNPRQAGNRPDEETGRQEGNHTTQGERASRLSQTGRKTGECGGSHQL